MFRAKRDPVNRLHRMTSHRQGGNCHEPLTSFVFACWPEGQGGTDRGQATAPFHTRSPGGLASTQ